jgi:hypothetical protein
MQKVYVPFSVGARCALVNWNNVQAFHACAIAPSFNEDARLELFTKEDIDRWKGLISLSIATALRAVRAWLDRPAADLAIRGARVA